MKYIARVIFMPMIAGISAGVFCQTTSMGAMPQYLFTEFKASRVLMKAGQTQTPEMNYNIVTEKMVFVRDKKYYDLTNPEMVDTIYLQDGKFVPVGKACYEFLVKGKNDLFAEHKGDLLTAGKPVGYGGTSQVSSSNYISSVQLSGMQYNLPLPPDFLIKQSVIYWIRTGEEMSSFINEKQFLKLFPAESVKLKSFIKENRIRFDNPEHLVKLVKYLNSL
jgi:hypothetical protein